MRNLYVSWLPKQIVYWWRAGNRSFILNISPNLYFDLNRLSMAKGIASWRNTTTALLFFSGVPVAELVNRKTRDHAKGKISCGAVTSNIMRWLPFIWEKQASGSSNGAYIRDEAFKILVTSCLKSLPMGSSFFLISMVSALYESIFLMATMNDRWIRINASLDSVSSSVESDCFVMMVFSLVIIFT